MPLNLFMNQIHGDFDGPCAINFKPYDIPELTPKDQDTKYKSDLICLLALLNKIAFFEVKL